MRTRGWLIVAAALVLVALGAGVAYFAVSNRTNSLEQSALDPFYADPVPMPAEPGRLLRAEPLTAADGTPVEVSGGSAYRILYSSRRPSGEVAVSGGMVFVPITPAPSGGRPVLAWAHGTVGQGDACAPSRSAEPTKPIASWLPIALRNGWVVVATDYTGLGTTGPELYLVGEAEAADVVHAIQSAQTVPDASPSADVVVMGHSQGGHAALWTGTLLPSIDPSLSLLGVAAIAPAAELPDIIGAQWDSAVAWVIGPEAMSAWPTIDPALTDSVLTSTARDETERLAQECISAAAIEGTIRQDLGESYFASDPLDEASWLAFTTAQIPAPLTDVPVYLAQSTTDNVVLAWPNAALQEKWCRAGSTLAATWVSDTSHMASGLVLGPDALQWAAARFAGDPAPRTCDVRPPIAPTAVSP